MIEGGKRLTGEVVISGAKNAALPILAACLLTSEPCRLRNVPRLADIATIKKLLEQLGTRFESDGETLVATTKNIERTEAPYDLVKTMRASILVLGPLLARCGQARVSLPGGCAIGARPVNLHLAGIEKLGATVEVEHGFIEARGRLKGGRIYLDLPTVTGTENLMMAATLAEGTTVIENAALEPEVVDLALFLERSGARIRGAGTPTVTIEGVRQLGAADYRILPDRIEAGTYLAAGAITEGDLFLRGARAEHLEAVVMKLSEAGAEVRPDGEGLRLRGPARIRSVDIKTMPYPGFPTDMQAQMMALMTLGSGLSVIAETVFESRFTHVGELRRMGGRIQVQGSSAIITGVPYLTGAPVMASDLRASAGLILAGLAARGETHVQRIYHLDRGYERLEEKLTGLGASVRRVVEPKASTLKGGA